jgi:GT2 family glycosyltransferase
VAAGTTVSVILPTAGTRARDGREPPFLASRALDATLRAAAGLEVEVVCPIGPEVDSGAVRDLQIRGEHVLKVVRDREPFHFSRRMNQAVAVSEGKVLVWLNDDVERHTDDRWLRSLVATALIPDVAGVGPKLLYPDDTVQTVGVRFLAGLPKHTGVGARAYAPGPMRSFITPHEQLAVTGAVFATRREVYDEVGGLTETLPVNFGDIDYCLKAQAKGYRILVETGVTLVHHESASRPLGVDPQEFAELARRWSVAEDPYWPWPDDADRYPPMVLNGSVPGTPSVTNR